MADSSSENERDFRRAQEEGLVMPEWITAYVERLLSTDPAQAEPKADICEVPPPKEKMRGATLNHGWIDEVRLPEIPTELRPSSGNAMWMLQADLATNGEIYRSHSTDDLLDFVHRTISSGIPTGMMPYSSQVGSLVAAAGALLTIADRVIREG